MCLWKKSTHFCCQSWLFLWVIKNVAICFLFRRRNILYRRGLNSTLQSWKAEEAAGCLFRHCNAQLGTLSRNILRYCRGWREEKTTLPLPVDIYLAEQLFLQPTGWAIWSLASVYWRLDDTTNLLETDVYFHKLMTRKVKLKCLNTDTL